MVINLLTTRILILIHLYWKFFHVEEIIDYENCIHLKEHAYFSFLKLIAVISIANCHFCILLIIKRRLNKLAKNQFQVIIQYHFM